MTIFFLFRQFDLRTPHACSREVSNVLVNLLTHLGRYAEAKCLAINPRRPELLAIGANDPYIRVYDRRMIKPTTVEVGIWCPEYYSDLTYFHFLKKGESKLMRIPERARSCECMAGEEQSREHAVCSQRICPGGPNSQFSILLWCFMVTVKMCEDFMNSGDKRIGNCSMSCTLSHFLLHQEIFYQKQHNCLYSLALGPLWLSCFPDWSALFWHNWGDRQNHRWCRTPSWNTSSRKHLQNGRNAGNGVYTLNWTT
jgi:hypothetical protein